MKKQYKIQRLYSETGYTGAAQHTNFRACFCAEDKRDWRDEWNDTLEQLRTMEKNEFHVALPVQGAVLAARVRISITAGLVDLNRLIRQATIRRSIVVQFIRMHRYAGHPDYVGVDMRDVERRAQTFATNDEPCIPNGLAEFFEIGSEEES